MLRIYTYTMLILLAMGCKPPLPQIEGIDMELWRRDKEACENTRIVTLETMKTERKKLKNLSEDQLIRLLGKPDENELMDRNKKFYIYYLEPGPSCENAFERPTKLVVYVNATGIAKDSFIE